MSCVHTSSGPALQSSGHTSQCNHSPPLSTAPRAAALPVPQPEPRLLPCLRSSDSNTAAVVCPYFSPVLWTDCRCYDAHFVPSYWRRAIALMQTPHRFRSKRQLWTYSGLGIETRDSAQYRYVHGQLQRTKKPQQIRGLNQNHNHEMKEIFKGAATRASCGVGPLRDFYLSLLAKGMKPEMARLTLARKIAAIALTLWKKEERFDAEQLKRQAA